MTFPSTLRPFHVIDAALRAGIVTLAVGTGYIHLTLGGPLFTLNAVGYLVGAAAMAAPVPVASRFRWAIRIGLAGYAATTIVAWAVQGPFYSTAYLAKGIEAILIALLVIDFIRSDGDPIALVAREARRGLARLRRLIAGLGLVVLSAAVLACSGAVASPTAPPSIDADALTISANGLEFSTATLSAPAGEPFQIVFDNQEGAPHNVAIYRDESAAEEVFVEEPFGGPRVEVYEVPALSAGDYFFRCDVHPDMKGMLTAG